MSNFLITGGAGFIGSYLAKALLKRGHKVRVLDNLVSGKRENLDPDIDFIKGDIVNSSDLIHALQDVEGCFHLAGVASVEICEKDWQYAHMVNALGTLNVFKVIAENCSVKIPVVLASTAAVYGNPQKLPLAETMQPSPISNYGLDKLYSEQVASLYAQVHRIPSASLRLFNVYGPGQPANSPYSGVMTKFISAILQNEPIQIFGDGTQTRDFIFVGDVVDKFIAIMEILLLDSKVNNYIVNICTSMQFSILQLANFLMEAFNKIVPITFQRAKIGDIKNSQGSNEYLSSLVNANFTELSVLALRSLFISSDQLLLAEKENCI